MKLALKKTPVWLKLSLSILFGIMLGCLFGEIAFTLIQS